MGVTIAVMGDTLCRSKDGSDPFAHARDVWAEADVCFLNLETVITQHGTPAPKRTLLRTEPDEAKWLEGFDVVHTANNHIFDYGEEGYYDTEGALHLRDIHSLGVGTDITAWMGATVEHKKFKIDFLGFHSYPLQSGIYEVAHLENHKRVLDQVRRRASLSDALIVSLHWGTEHAPHPSPAQIEIAHDIVDAGACLVLGHGPHRLQAIERYKDGLIAYSLGNFNFWHTDIEEQWFNCLSAILLVEMGEAGVLNWRIKPYFINANGQPIPYGNRDEMMTLYLAELQAELSITWSRWYEEIGATYVRQSLKSFAATIPRYGWVRVKKLWWWLRQAHTWQAVAGMLRGWTK